MAIAPRTSTTAGGDARRVRQPVGRKKTAAVCGGQEDNKRAPPVCSFAANRFGLYNKVGNVW